MTKLGIDFGKLIASITRDVSSEIERDRVIERAIYEKMKNYEYPYLLFKQYGSRHDRIDYTLIVGKCVSYHPRNTLGIGSAGILYGSSMMRLKDGQLRIASKELQDQMMSIDDQIRELEKKKRELLHTYWPRCKKLSCQKAEEFDEIRKQIWGLKKQ